MVKRALLVFVGVLVSTVLYAQYTYRLQWDDNLRFTCFGGILEDQKAFLHFEGAQYPDQARLWPHFFKAIPLAGSANAKVEIVDPQYEVLNSQQSKQIVDVDQLPENLLLEEHIVFQRQQAYLSLRLLPLRRHPTTRQVERLKTFTLKLTHLPSKPSIKKGKTLKEESVLASGYWQKIRIDEDGVYRLSFDELRELGIEQADQVRLFGRGAGMLPFDNDQPRIDDLQEIPLLVQDDAILFFAQGADQWYYDEAAQMFLSRLHTYSNGAYYFLTSDYTVGSPKRIASTSETGAAQKEVNYFIDYQHHENNTKNMIKSGQIWLGEAFETQSTQRYNFDFPHINTGKAGKVLVYAVAQSPQTTKMSVKLAAQEKEISFKALNITSSSSPKADRKFALFDFQPASDQLSVNLTYDYSGLSYAWLDFITINAERELYFEGSQMRITYREESNNPQMINFNIANANDNLQVWDVSDIHNIRAYSLSDAGTSASFKALCDDVHHYWLFDGQNYKTPITEGDDVGVVDNQNLHAHTHADMIIVCHPMFQTQAEELAQLHRTYDQLSTHVVSTKQVYNEFSSGTPDITAIRDYTRMIYTRSNGEDTLRYLLLYGDGSYDNKNYAAQAGDNSNLIPTYQSTESFYLPYSYVSDDFFALMDDTESKPTGLANMLDIGVGRFPVQTLEEGQAVLDKVKGYYSADALGDWRNSLCMLADDEDNSLYLDQTEIIATRVKKMLPQMNIEKIYLDAYPQVITASGARYPAVNEAFLNRMGKGALLVNYIGHGGELGLAHEKILTISEINSWSNSPKLPLFITATCEFSRFDDYNRTAAGELVLLNPDGGAIALFTTTRLVYAHSNYQLNTYLYQYIFMQDEDGGYLRFGDIFRHAKNNIGDTNKLNFTLLGDPAIRLPMPKDSIATTSIVVDDSTYINESTINQPGYWMLDGSDIQATPTLSALSKVTIKGIVLDDKGQKDETFEGTVYPTVFDKPQKINSLINDPNNSLAPDTFEVQSNIIYRGKATVNGGNFNFSFIVPKDITYRIDYGRISYYAENGVDDASSYEESVIVGGISQNHLNDKQGPDIELFLNDRNFVFGGLTDESPLLLAYVFDSSGVNTVGSGIGHDITAVIDQNTNDALVLNDAYQADKDSYQSGLIEYHLKKVPVGPHNLRLKVWDVANNSSEAYLEFIVAESAELVLSNVLNYPNPFTTHTSFYFNHNQPHIDLSVLLQIFTVSGRLIKSLEVPMNTAGYLSDPISWDGKDDFGDPIGRGVYVYRLRVASPDGSVAEKFEKLVILK